jgi:hypothetical protein
VVASTAVVVACVPETDHLWFVGWAVALAAIAELVSRRLAPLAVHALLVGIVGWAAIYGTAGRPGAVVGALFAWWPIVAGPTVALVTGRPRGEAVPEGTWWAIAALAASGSLVVARTGALDVAARAAAIGSAVVAVACVGVGIALVSARPSRRRT